MNSNYRHYFKRQYGLKESQLPPSLVERDSFPGIDPDELEMGAEDEKGEHHMSPDKARQTAIQHLKAPDQHHYYTGMEKAKEKGMLRDMLMGKIPSAADQLTSPTAISTPIIGVAVRGSCTGGLPSGADQVSKNITPSNLGGYTPIPTNQANSRLIDKTPTNSNINASTPINKNPVTVVEPHPHQIQNDAGEAPQAVTGASADSGFENLTLKSAAPKALDIDVSEKKKEENHEFEPTADQNPESTSPNREGDREGAMNETFYRHKKLMRESIGIVAENDEEKTKLWKSLHPDKPKVDKDARDSDLWDKNISPPSGYKVHEPSTRVNPETGAEEELQERYSAPFEKMRGLANLGDRRVSSNGLWEGIGASEPFNTNWKMDSEKAGMVKVDEKWPKSDPTKKDALRKDVGAQKGKPIPDEKLEALKKTLHAKSQTDAGLTEKELTLSRRVNAALNARSANK